MNDPNGVIQWDGKFHLFYQNYPFMAVHRDMHWGHAVSEDLIHWRDLPVALAPIPDSYDESGVFSGCAVDNDGVPTIVYTATSGQGSRVQVQALATGSGAELVDWERHPANPVLSEVPAISGQSRDFRDPFVWREGDAWNMAVGCRIEGAGGMILLYRSPDLVDWDFVGPLLTGDREKHGIMWECPNFFRWATSGCWSSRRSRVPATLWSTGWLATLTGSASTRRRMACWIMATTTRR